MVVDIYAMLKPVRGCATDEQFNEIHDRVEAALQRVARHKVKWAVGLLREAAGRLEGHKYSGDAPLIAQIRQCVRELD